MNQGEIYIITNKINNKQYVGQAVSYSSNGTKRGSIQRWKDHVYSAMKGRAECRLLELAIKKYGPDNFNLEILLICNIEKLNYYEGHFMKAYNSIAPHGYNLRIEGENGRLHSQETKEKMSETRTGKKHSEITKEKIGKAHKNRKVSTETRIKTGETSKFRGMKEETLASLTEKLKEVNLDKLPMYMTYHIDKRYKNKLVDGILVKKPGLAYKQFMSQKLPFQEKLDLANQYLNENL